MFYIAVKWMKETGKTVTVDYYTFWPHIVNLKFYMNELGAFPKLRDVVEANEST